MADNLTTQTTQAATIPPNSAIATDEVGGVHFQRVKLDVGGDGASAPLSNANPVPISDAGQSVTVDGTVSIGGALPAGGNTIGNVGVVGGSVGILPPLPTPLNVIGGGAEATALRVTLANDSTGVVSVDDNGGSLTVDGSVSLVAPIPAGGNTIGSVASVTTSITPGTAAVHLGKTEDAPHGSGDTGVLGLAVRRDANTSLVDADGDYAPLQVNVTGALKVAMTSGVGADFTLDEGSFVAGAAFVGLIGGHVDEVATSPVGEGEIGAVRITTDRKQIVTPYAHAGAGGHTPYKNLDVDETEDEIKGTQGKLFWIHVINLSTATRFLKFYNDTAANVVVGTTVPVLTFPVPTLGDTNGAGFTMHFGDHGVQFTTAITVAATTGLADNDTGAPGANEVILNAGFL